MIADLRALCARLGVDVVAVHVDDGISGAIRKRPAFTAWLDDARTGNADVLAAYAVDRLSREGLPVAAMILDVLNETGARLVDAFGLDSYGDQEAFRWSFLVKAEVARAERDRMVQRSRDRVRRARAERRWPGGAEPYGYKAIANPDGPGKVLALDTDEAERLRYAAQEVLAGRSILSLVREFNTAGVPTRYAGKQWTRAGLVAMLTGQAQLGHLVLEKTPRDEDGRPLPTRLLTGDDGLPIKVWPPIFTPAQHAALVAACAQTPLAEDERERRRQTTHDDALLAGLVVCGRCGGPMRRRAGVKRRRTELAPDGRRTRTAYVVDENGEPVREEPTYVCVTYSRGGKCGTSAGGPSVRADWLDAYVAEAFLSAYGRLDAYEHRAVPSEADDELAAVEAAIGQTTAGLAANATAEAFARLQSLQARRDELRAMPATPRVELVGTGQTVAERWAGMDADGKPLAAGELLRVRREMLADAYVAVEVAPGERRRTRTLDAGRVALIPRDAGELPDADADDGDHDAVLRAAL